MEPKTNHHWDVVQSLSARIRDSAIQQLLDLFAQYKDVDNYPPLWGDEIEYQLLSFDESKRTVRLLLEQDDVLNRLHRRDEGQEGETEHVRQVDGKRNPIFQPEFGSFMVEATPGAPYDNSLSSTLSVQGDMTRRRRMIQQMLRGNEAVVTIPGFPRLGAPGTFTQPALPSGGQLLRSQFLPDGMVSTYERYGTIHDNVYARREGRAFKVKVPIFRDKSTPWPWRESDHFDLPNGAQLQQREQRQEPRHPGDDAENFIYGDSMSFGPSFCGLQVTLQASNLREARYLHDQLCPVGPILMALSAGTPFFRGFLTATDVRWNQAAVAVDDRTANELPSKKGTASLPPRWAPTSMYIADDPRLRPEYNLPSIAGHPDRTITQKLQSKGMDAPLASYYANILARDPIAMTEKDLESYIEADAEADPDLDVFEILHSAVWPHVDFKLPSKKDGQAGWRVELRPLEVQLTDFDNAAFVVFVALLTRTILHFNLNFYIPIGKVAENMARAHTRNAVVEERFFFRRDVSSSSSSSSAAAAAEQATHEPFEAEYALMSADEIMNGSRSLRSDGTQSTSSSFEGLIPLVKRYIREFYAGECERGHERGQKHEQEHEHERGKVDVTADQLFKYLDMIGARAAGTLPTPATWMRQFVQRHERYSRDSVVSERICYDLMCAIRDLEDREGDQDGEQERIQHGDSIGN
ncbi:hypothetical protein PV04_04658 [Phialophora macrospora]|uniref:Glutamate--cysteine ligase n=1 Tax=Phialophora macrospora TaxID=1851006 RepID=A0A0D2G9V2_9EURO|nr:hypothetical protein PV04_04658 [Phialophora macrospora]